MSRVASNRMLVEGLEDQFCIIQLMKHHITWPEDKTQCPVLIETGGSADEILAKGFLSTKLKSSEVKTLGVVLDADEDCDGRWKHLRARCIELFPSLPTKLPSTGAIVENADSKRFGAWIMPDNVARGMLETFLRYLVRDQNQPVFVYAKEAIAAAKQIGAPYSAVHVDKALIHTWLAWQDPPGEALGRALTRKTLDPHAEAAKPFIKWFVELYQIKEGQK
jgi:hypothetical protein